MCPLACPACPPSRRTLTAGLLPLDCKRWAEDPCFLLAIRRLVNPGRAHAPRLRAAKAMTATQAPEHPQRRLRGSMALGVNVIADARRDPRPLRDGVPDGGNAQPPEGQGWRQMALCLTHPDGWETQFAPYAGASIAVERRAGRRRHIPSVLTRYSGFSSEFRASGISSCARNGEVTRRRSTTPGAAERLRPPRARTRVWSTPVPTSRRGYTDVGFAEGVRNSNAIQAGRRKRGPALGRSRPMVPWAIRSTGGARCDTPRPCRINGCRGAQISRAEMNPRTPRGAAVAPRAADARCGLAPLGFYRGEVRLPRLGQITCAVAAVTVCPDRQYVPSSFSSSAGLCARPRACRWTRSAEVAESPWRQGGRGGKPQALRTM